jgi:hypothetical protein
MEGHAHKELVKTGLVIHEDQIGPFAFVFERFYMNMIPVPDIEAEESVNQFHGPLVPGLYPLFFLFHVATSY